MSWQEDQEVVEAVDVGVEAVVGGCGVARRTKQAYGLATGRAYEANENIQGVSYHPAWPCRVRGGEMRVWEIIYLMTVTFIICKSPKS